MPPSALIAALSTLAAFACNAASPPKPEANKSKTPNALFILTDDNGVHELGYSSNGAFLTPNIDRLANEGVILENFHTHASICTPSRYSFLTGVHAGNCSWPRFRETFHQQIYCMNWFTNFEPGRRTIGTLFQDNGYATGYIGKWHNAGIPESKLAFEAIQREADPADPKVAAALALRYERIQQTVRSYGFDFAESLTWVNNESRPVEKLRQHNLEWIAKGAIDFLDKVERLGKPFYLQVNFTIPHGPHHILSAESDPRICEYGYTRENLAGIMPPRPTLVPRVKAAGLPANHDTVGRLWLDDAVGAVVAHLDRLGLRENTIIFVMSDHGSSPGKSSCYELGVRAPALVHWKGTLAPGKRNAAFIANTDFLPTVAAACGIALPGDLPLDGANRWPQIQGAPDDREEVFLEVGYSRAVKTARWKYIATRYPDEVLKRLKSGEFINPLGRKGPNAILDGVYPHYYEQDQLFDLQKDPKEQTNLARNPEFASVLAEMKQRLQRHLDRIPYPFPLEPQPFLDSPEYAAMVKRALADDSGLQEEWYVTERTLTR